MAAVSTPATCTLPVVGRRMHPMIESSVVFPLPDGPINSSTSPLQTSRSTASKAETRTDPSA